MELIHKDQRIGIFIDIQNLYHSAKNLYQSRVNFRELLKILTNGRKLIRAVAYTIKSEAVTGEKSFFEALGQVGLELRMKDLQIFASGIKKGDWDVGLAVDAIRMANSLDTVILVTGDGDFLPLVEYLKWGLGKQVEVAAFSKTASVNLREAADHFTALEEIPRILMRKK